MKSNKHQVIENIFLGLRTNDKVSDVLPFNNEQVKYQSSKVKFRNPFDATKFDDYNSLPECLKKTGFFCSSWEGESCFCERKWVS
jgi:hypothetical protein|tara:strand:- start:305 stop:559 length:255 start_codon:yes stop_codon:yes gene_type:complete